MKKKKSKKNKGFTLIELTLCIALILFLSYVIVIGVGGLKGYKEARGAGDILRSVKGAQRLFLADNPTLKVADCTVNTLTPYMPQQVWPTLPKGPNNENPAINFKVYPPVATTGGGAFDPSPKANDGLWDAGD